MLLIVVKSCVIHIPNPIHTASTTGPSKRNSCVFPSKRQTIPLAGLRGQISGQLYAVNMNLLLDSFWILRVGHGHRSPWRGYESLSLLTPPEQVCPTAVTPPPRLTNTHSPSQTMQDIPSNILVSSPHDKYYLVQLQRHQFRSSLSIWEGIHNWLRQDDDAAAAAREEI